MNYYALIIHKITVGVCSNQELKCGLGNQWQWMKVMLCLWFLSATGDTGLFYECSDIYHTKLNTKVMSITSLYSAGGIQWAYKT
jgi:hypothetical protein